MIQKAVSQALTAFFMLKKSLKNFSSCDFPLATAIFGGDSKSMMK